MVGVVLTHLISIGLAILIDYILKYNILLLLLLLLLLLFQVAITRMYCFNRVIDDVIFAPNL